MHALSTATPATTAPLESTHARVAPFFASAFFVDAAVNLTLVGVPYKALGLGASPLVLGLLPAAWSVVYIAGAILLGRLSDRTPRLRLVRTGVILCALACVVLAVSPAIPGLFAGVMLLALGLSMFWPSLQSALSEADAPHRLRTNLGYFNLSWSSGKGLGFASGGLLLATAGFPILCGVSAAVLIAVAALLGAGLMRTGPIGAPTPAADPGHLPDRSSGKVSPPDDGGPPPHRRTAFLAVAWIANGVAYGINATLGYHYPKFLDEIGIGSAHFGLFLGSTYLAQTVTFFFLMRTRAWHYRFWPIALLHVILAIVLVLIPFLRNPSFAVLFAPLVGGALGLAYYSSIFYSLDAAARPGRNTGFHEAIIGSGVLLAPPLGGALVHLVGRLDAPYFLCAAVSLAAIGAQALVLRRSLR